MQKREKTAATYLMLIGLTLIGVTCMNTAVADVPGYTDLTPEKPAISEAEAAIFCTMDGITCETEKEEKEEPAKDPTLTQVKSTAFSSVECHTTWCTANAGQPRGKKVALNAKFGKAKQIYVPVFDKTYEVIGTTDQNTDLDIWFGDDHAAALAYGSKTIDIQIIK